MEALAEFLVNQPAHVLLLAAVYFLIWAMLRVLKAGVFHHPNAFLVPTEFTLIYAGWEWWVNLKTPDADIRVDLLLIWPLLVILTLWALIRSFRQ